jgi:Mn-dependent DtxR family transcriptional regulator
VLKESGYIEHESYGSIKLTELGRKKAMQMITRHETITAFLKNTLNIDAETAEEDACRIEHIISQKTADAIKKYADRMKQS